jgi:hydroxymethylpyrimidine pyrophosphatase-like HAD family hydrolase
MLTRSNTGRFRVVALDIDGTVLDSRHHVVPGLDKLLARLSARSVRTVLCTGRRWRTALPVLAQLEHVDPVVVCCGGALVKEAGTEETLCTFPMRPAAAGRSARVLREAGLVPFVLYDRPSEQPEMMVSRTDRSRADRLPYVRANVDYFEWYDGDFPGAHEPALEVFTLDTTELVRTAEARIRATLGDGGVVRAMGQPRYGADQVALEVHDPAATKWNALRGLLRGWSIAAEEVVAVGDDVNDIPMLSQAGLSFAMGNAAPSVKAAARAVTATNDERGVLTALEAAFCL